MEQNFNEPISMKNSGFFFFSFTSVFHPSTEDSFFDLIWASRGVREHVEGNLR